MALPASFPLKVKDNKTVQIPSVGYGTWASGDTSWAKDATLTALKAGYRHLDCAWMYGVDNAVGQAIKESGIPREQIFVTSKFWPHFAEPGNVELCLDKVLKGMGLEYVDLWLSHWPVAYKPIDQAHLEKAYAGPDTTNVERGLEFDKDEKPVIDWKHTSEKMCRMNGQQGSFVPTWKAMQDCVRKGKAKAVGVSNFAIEEMEELVPHQDDIPISCNQVEVHPWLPQNELRAWCTKHDVVLTCYSPFAGQKADGATLLKDQKIVDLAKKNGMGEGQLLQSWAVQRGTVPLGKSATPERIRANLDVKKLSEEDMKTLDGMEIPGGEGRTIRMRKEWLESR